MFASKYGNSYSLFIDSFDHSFSNCLHTFIAGMTCNAFMINLMCITFLIIHCCSHTGLIFLFILYTIKRDILHTCIL